MEEEAVRRAAKRHEGGANAIIFDLDLLPELQIPVFEDSIAFVGSDEFQHPVLFRVKFNLVQDLLQRFQMNAGETSFFPKLMQQVAEQLCITCEDTGCDERYDENRAKIGLLAEEFDAKLVQHLDIKQHLSREHGELKRICQQHGQQVFASRGEEDFIPFPFVVEELQELVTDLHLLQKRTRVDTYACIAKLCKALERDANLLLDSVAVSLSNSPDWRRKFDELIPAWKVQRLRVVHQEVSRAREVISNVKRLGMQLLLCKQSLRCEEEQGLSIAVERLREEIAEMEREYHLRCEEMLGIAQTMPEMWENIELEWKRAKMDVMGSEIRDLFHSFHLFAHDSLRAANFMLYGQDRIVTEDALQMRVERIPMDDLDVSKLRRLLQTGSGGGAVISPCLGCVFAEQDLLLAFPHQAVTLEAWAQSGMRSKWRLLNVLTEIVDSL